MGADLILAIADAPQPQQFQNHDILRRIVRNSVLDATAETIDLVIDYLFDPSLFGTDRKEVAERAEEALNNLLNDALRDVVYTEIHGNYVWISGGMSWGDTPTESYDDVVIMDMLQPQWANGRLQ